MVKITLFMCLSDTPCEGRYLESVFSSTPLCVKEHIITCVKLKTKKWCYLTTRSFRVV